MKIRHIALIVFASSTAIFAGLVQPWDNAKPATLSLPDAYKIATSALGSSPYSATNQFHCISAAIYSDAVVSPYGGWLFTFCSTNKQPISKYVTVEFSGRFHIEDTLARLE
jgi:hypothetical protein